MTEATRKALVDIDGILRDAGWESPPPSHPSLNEHDIGALRVAYHSLLRDEYFLILENTLGKRFSIREASALMGISDEEGRKLFAEALERLADFVEQGANH